MSTNRECQWSAQSDAPWLTLSSPAAGQGPGTLQFTVSSNSNASSRSAGISVNDQRLEISQDGKPCEFIVSSNREAVDGLGGDLRIDVRASAAECSWTAASNVAWVKIASGQRGTGNGTVTLHVDAANGPPRSGTVTVAGQTVQIDQGTGCSYSIATDTVTVDAPGGDRQVPVSAPAGCTWIGESHATWIAIGTGSPGSGPGAVSFRVSPTDGPSRTGTLSVAGRTVVVTQLSGCSVSIAPSSLNVAAQGGASSIQISAPAGCSWSAASAVTWITVGDGGGGGSGIAQISVAANAGPARTGTVTIAGQTVAIAQASGCTYNVSPTAIDVAGTGGPGSAALTTAAGCTWTASGAPSWISISTPSGAGPGQVTFSVASNASPPRSGTFTIAGRVITVKQASLCTWTLAPPSHEFDAAGGAGNVLVIVSGACAWSASSTTDWIQMTAGMSGTGNGLVQFTVSPNPGPARTGVLSIAGQSYSVREGGR